MSVHSVAPIGVTAETPSFSTSGNVVSGSGATSTITTPTGQIATVTNGVITNVGAGVNIQYFENIIKQTTNIVAELNFIKSGNFGLNVEQEVQQSIQAQLQNLTNQIIPDIMGLINGASAQLAVLTPAVPLVTFPVTDLATAVAFINSFKTNVLAFQVLAPYTNLITQVASLAAQLASLTSAIKSSSAAITPAGQPGVQIPGSPSVQSTEKVAVRMTVTRV